MKNIFLTGEMGCGKTTAIKKYLSLSRPDCGGFVTLKATEGNGTENWLFLMGSYGQQLPPTAEALEEGVVDQYLFRFFHVPFNQRTHTVSVFGQISATQSRQNLRDI
ncbi:MAG: hypothetical protein J5822_07065, partial [Eubacteriaceae bacterium]|nr:hypothetical protein [Eubacteriaceae bacterium]